LGARNFPSVIWLEGLEQEGYSSLYGWQTRIFKGYAVIVKRPNS
jgi:hypothetical protein